MAYTVEVAFRQFHEKINLGDRFRDTANKRRDAVVSLLENDFEILEAFATGSIPRYTALKAHADLDVIVALHYGKHIEGNKPSEVLQAVRDTLAGYRTQVKKNGQAVTLHYKTWPKVDIVPASRVTSEGKLMAYKIPDMNTEVWLRSKPKRHSRAIEDRSSSAGTWFRRIVKMAKHWNRSHSSFLQSYHIEVMALRIITGSASDVPWNVFQFFKESSELANSPLWHDGGFADDYLDYSSRSEAVKRLENAANIARDAWYATYDENDDHQSAIEGWRRIFGNDFPAYG